MKLKKGSVVIYVLALMLVTAGYWNYIENESQMLETVSVSKNNNSEENENQDSVDENLGDATLVSNNELATEEIKKDSEEYEKDEEDKEVISQPNNSDDYYEESRLSRDTMYSQTLETYQNILNNSNVSEEQKTIVTQEITELNKEKNAIMICENLIKTKGFDDCVIFVNIDSISVIVKSDELKIEEIAQIQNIISREMNAQVENIHIMTK